MLPFQETALFPRILLYIVILAAIVFSVFFLLAILAYFMVRDEIDSGIEGIDLADEPEIDTTVFDEIKEEMEAEGFRYIGDYAVDQDSDSFEVYSCFAGPDDYSIATLSACFSTDAEEEDDYVFILRFVSKIDNGKWIETRNDKKSAMMFDVSDYMQYYHYPGCSVADLLKFHKKHLKEYGILTRMTEGIEDVPGSMRNWKNEHLSNLLNKGVMEKKKSGKVGLTKKAALNASFLLFKSITNKLNPFHREYRPNPVYRKDSRFRQ